MLKYYIQSFKELVNLLQKKSYDDMSINELMKELKKANKKSGFTPRKLKNDSNGTILLDSNNKDDLDWFHNDEDYDVIK